MLHSTIMVSSEHLPYSLRILGNIINPAMQDHREI